MNDTPIPNPGQQAPSSLVSFRRNPIKTTTTQPDNKKLTAAINNLTDQMEAANDAPPVQQAAPANDSIFDPTQIEAANDVLHDQLDTIQETQHIIDQQLVEDQQQTKSLAEIVSANNTISAKLDTLSNRLKEKYDASNDAANDAPKVEPDTTTSDALGDRQAPPEPQRELPEVIPEEPRPSNDLLDNKSQEVEGAPGSGFGAKVINAMNATTGAVKAGFAKSIAISDRISGMLFKYTITQAVNAAKMAAAIFAIILGLDLLKIAWQAWGDLIMAKLDEWGKLFGEWWDGFKEWTTYFSDMKFAFEGMSGDLLGIRNAWESGNWPALAAAIGNAFIDGLKTLSGLLDRMITKLIATVLRKIGFKDTADSVEAEGLQRYQNMTNNRLSPENQKKLAAEQIKREEKDGLTPTQRGITSFLPDSFRRATNLISKEEYDQIQSEKADQAARKNLSTDDKIANVAAGNEAREAVARYKNIVDNTNPDNAAQVANANKYKKEAQDYINNPALAKTPTVKAELQKQLDALVLPKSTKNNVKPVSSAENKDTQTVKNIQVANAEAKKAKDGSGANQTANIQNNIVKTNKSVNVHNPITSTPAPGIYKATGVN